jgi:hypothetical protein
MGFSVWELRGNQRLTSEEERRRRWCLGLWAIGMGREEASATLEPEKRGRARAAAAAARWRTAEPRGGVARA